VTEYLVAAAAKKELQDLPADAIERLISQIREPQIRELSGSPRPVGCKKLHGYKSRWRVRVGNYRIVYSIDDDRKAVDITRIAHRKDVYE
jgi:mRNA interferase RelE/StbE